MLQLVVQCTHDVAGRWPAEAEWAPGPVWTGVENLAPPEFDPRTVQPVASRYTDYTTQPTFPVGARDYCLYEISRMVLGLFPLG